MFFNVVELIDAMRLKSLIEMVAILLRVKIRSKPSGFWLWSESCSSILSILWRTSPRTFPFWSTVMVVYAPEVGDAKTKSVFTGLLFALVL